MIEAAQQTESFPPVPSGFPIHNAPLLQSGGVKTCILSA